MVAQLCLDELRVISFASIFTDDFFQLSKHLIAGLMQLLQCLSESPCRLRQGVELLPRIIMMILLVLLFMIAAAVMLFRVRMS